MKTLFKNLFGTKKAVRTKRPSVRTARLSIEHLEDRMLMNADLEFISIMDSALEQDSAAVETIKVQDADATAAADFLNADALTEQAGVLTTLNLNELNWEKLEEVWKSGDQDLLDEVGRSIFEGSKFGESVDGFDVGMGGLAGLGSIGGFDLGMGASDYGSPETTSGRQREVDRIFSTATGGIAHPNGPATYPPSSTHIEQTTTEPKEWNREQGGGFDPGDKDMPADDGTGPVGPAVNVLSQAGTLFMPADDGTGPVGPNINVLSIAGNVMMPADDGSGPVGPAVNVLSQAGTLFMPANDGTGPVGPVSTVANLAYIGALANVGAMYQ